jgi:AcrR family transcriptional regulator
MDTTGNSSTVEFMAKPKRAGRRPGTSGTRDAILAAARQQFADQGYDRTTLRSVAAQAGVDPALVVHFFGSKQGLFLAGVELPFEPADLAARISESPRERVGELVANFALGVLDDPEARSRWLAIIRAAASEPEVARLLRRTLETRVFAPIVEALGVEDAPLRVTLAGTQLVGIAMGRYIVGLKPLVTADSKTIAAAIAPTLQRYLVGPL